jgi:hypothetical protein
MNNYNTSTHNQGNTGKGCPANASKGYTVPVIRRDRVRPTSADPKHTKHVHPFKLAQRRRDYRRAFDANQGSPANVPAPRRSPDDVIVPVRQPGRPAPMREAIPYINVPGPGQTWQQLNEWRQAFGLAPVTSGNQER